MTRMTGGREGGGGSIRPPVMSPEWIVLSLHASHSHSLTLAHTCETLPCAYPSPSADNVPHPYTGGEGLTRRS